MATNEITLKWLQRKTDESEHGINNCPEGICPVIGAAAYAWHDWLPSVEDRTEIIYPMVDALAKSKDATKEPLRRAALATWLNEVAYPAWVAYAQFYPGESGEDTAAEMFAMNQGNGISSVNSHLGQSGTSVAAFVAQGIVLGLTRDSKAMKARAAKAAEIPKVKSSRKDQTVKAMAEDLRKAGATLTDEQAAAVLAEKAVTPLEIQTRIFCLCFCTPGNPQRTIENLQDSFGALLQTLLAS